MQVAALDNSILVFSKIFTFMTFQFMTSFNHFRLKNIQKTIDIFLCLSVFQLYVLNWDRKKSSTNQ